jgi:acetyl esterase/lipase
MTASARAACYAAASIREVSMSSCLRLVALTLIVLSGTPPTTHAEEVPAPPDIRDFFRNPQVNSVVLSPNGEHYAMLVSVDGQLRLGIGTSGTPTDFKLIDSVDNADIRFVAWVSDDRLVFTVASAFDSAKEVRGYAPGLLAINRDGSHYRELISPVRRASDQTGTHIRSTVLTPNFTLFSLLHDGSSNIVVGEYTKISNTERVFDTLHLYRLDTNSGEIKTLLQNQPQKVLSWWLDSDGLPRVAVSWHEDRRTIYYRDAESDSWHVIGDFNADNGEGFMPVHIGVNGVLYVSQGGGADGDGQVYRYDFQKHAVEGAPLYRAPGFDFSGSFEEDRPAHKILGIHYLADAQGTAWLDPTFATLQKTIDAILPSTINQITCGDCLTSKYVLVRAFSDRQPLMFLLFDRQSGRMVQLGAQRPWIKPAQMGLQEFDHYRARDGRMIPVYFTLPAGHKTGPLPTVVLVHGGPWVRGTQWGWSDATQFLASRGYLVIEPEFRGSAGFGYEHMAAGFRQWGLAMQDDLADAARWAIERRLADPRSIAIGGSSYGGYATLMGLIKNPETFRCGFEFAGVTDLNLLYSQSWSDISEEVKQYRMTTLVGDPVADAGQFKLTSPLANAERLQQPLLMAYALADRIVPIAHGTRFRDAVARSNARIEWVTYSGEGHGFSILADAIDYWGRIERFLASNLAPP